MREAGKDAGGGQETSNLLSQALCYAFMLKHDATILTNYYASFLNKNASTIRQRTYIVRVKT